MKEMGLLAEQKLNSAQSAIDGFKKLISGEGFEVDDFDIEADLEKSDSKELDNYLKLEQKKDEIAEKYEIAKQKRLDEKRTIEVEKELTKQKKIEEAKKQIEQKSFEKLIQIRFLIDF